MSGQTYTTLGQYGNVEDRSCSECDNIIESSYLPYIFDINFRKKQNVNYELVCDTCPKENLKEEYDDLEYDDLEEDFVAGLGAMRGGGGGRRGGGGYRPRGGGGRYRPRPGMGIGHWRRHPRRYGYPIYDYTYPVYNYPIYDYPVYNYTYPHSACYSQETDGTHTFTGCFPQCSSNELNKGVYEDKNKCCMEARNMNSPNYKFSENSNC